MTAARGHRGFVMPVVILLVIMVGAVSAIMLERHIARAKTVQRQILAYQEHHGVRSIQTVIEAWRKTPTAQPRDIAEMLESDGLALSIEPGDGTSIGVYLFPGQDTMLRRISGLSDDEKAAAERALRLLRESVDDDATFERLLRDAGPLAVDVNQASPPVISAIVRAVLGDAADEYESKLLDARLSGETIGLQTLSNIATEAEIEGDRRALLGRFFTVTPDVWRFRIDVRGTDATGVRRLYAQYGGLILLGGSATSTAASTFEQPTPFLSWERLNPDDPRAVK